MQSAYTPDKCKIAIDHLKQGKAVESMVHKLGVAKSTIYEWMANIPEFKAAVDHGRSLGQEFWEEQGIKSLWQAKDFNNVVYLHTIKCQYKVVEDKTPEKPQDNGLTDNKLIEMTDEYAAKHDNN